MVRMGSGDYKNRIRGLVGLESLFLFLFSFLKQNINFSFLKHTPSHCQTHPHANEQMVLQVYEGEAELSSASSLPWPDFSFFLKKKTIIVI